MTSFHFTFHSIYFKRKLNTNRLKTDAHTDHCVNAEMGATLILFAFSEMSKYYQAAESKYIVNKLYRINLFIFTNYARTCQTTNKVIGCFVSCVNKCLQIQIDAIDNYYYLFVFDLCHFHFNLLYSNCNQFLTDQLAQLCLCILFACDLCWN